MNRKGSALSYSMQEPEWPPVCECKYDEVQDRVDREDCLLHDDMEEKYSPPLENRVTLRKPATITKRGTESAA
jgi:hypothetical protein